MEQPDLPSVASEYRLHVIGPTGRVSRVISLHSCDDEEATALAFEVEVESAAELWQCGRLVAHWRSGS